MSSDERAHDPKEELLSGLRAAREEARLSPEEPVKPGPYPTGSPSPTRLPPLEPKGEAALPTSPDREALNRLWNVGEKRRGRESSRGSRSRSAVWFASLSDRWWNDRSR